MREIRFRAWDIKDEKMVNDPYLVEVYHYSDENRVNQKVYRYYEDWRGLEDGRGFNCELMQYTGLKDKRGKEIWEGDILKSCDDARNGMKFYYIVEWGHHAWSVRHYTIKRIHSVTSNNFFSGSQVIGNIYQNPELLSSNNP